jgi:hypothetical protein
MNKNLLSAAAIARGKKKCNHKSHGKDSEIK